MDLEKIVAKAKQSAWGLYKLNLGLGWLIPFNKPHRIKLVKIEDEKVITRIPFRRKNLNHIRGIHACGLATAAEFASGFLLLTHLGSKKYRLIMESIEMKYHYQAKSDVTAVFEAGKEWVNQEIVSPLQQTESVFVRCEIKLYDSESNHVATGFTNWQIKDWSKVKTKV